MQIKTNQPLITDRQKITKKITDFWNTTTDAWSLIWGPHIHHGFYENEEKITPIDAQEKLIEKLTEYLSLKQESKILDVGCGMGGSSLYLAKKYNATVTGVTLSSRQIEIATERMHAEKISNVNFKIEDALSLKSFENNSFDSVWALESCEQFFDKKLFLEQAFRVLKPGGKLMLATWCSGAEEYQDSNAKKYKKICDIYDLPYMPTINHYNEILKKQNFKILNEFDWSFYVKKSWDVGLTLANAYTAFQLIRLAGWRSINAIKKLKIMQEGFRENILKYGVFVAEK